MSKPIEIVAVKKRPETKVETQIEPVPQPQTKKKIIKSPSGKTGAKKPQPQPEPQINQSIGLFSGCLTLENERLLFRCQDGALIPICGIDGKLSLWLLAHPVEAFSTESTDWIVYPKSHIRTGELAVYLKGRVHDESEAGLKLMLKPDTARIKGKVLFVDGEKLIIGIRRNLSTSAFKELASKGMLHGSEFEQFKVPVYGIPNIEQGQFIELDCKRVGDRLEALCPNMGTVLP